MKIPRQWILITLYMVIIYCVILAEIHYAREHPLVDETPIQAKKHKDTR